MTFVTQFLKNVFSFFPGNLEIMHLLIRRALTLLKDEHLLISPTVVVGRDGAKGCGMSAKGQELWQSACRACTGQLNKDLGIRGPALKPQTIVSFNSNRKD